MSKRLFLAGGIFNSFFAFFHIWLGGQIQMLPMLGMEYKSLLQMLNVGAILTVAFAALASFFCADDLINTRLGRVTVVLVALYYATRAVEEIILAPEFSPVIFGVCLLVAILYGLGLAWTVRKPALAEVA